MKPDGAGPLTGLRAVAAGAAMYGAGFAAFKSRHFLRERIAPRSGDDRTEAAPRDEFAGKGRRGSRPSLDLPPQRWARVPVSRRA